MSGKIFYRERTKAKEGNRTPRFRILAVSDLDLNVYGCHFRKKELEQIADACKAKLIQLENKRKSKKK